MSVDAKYSAPPYPLTSVECVDIVMPGRVLAHELEAVSALFSNKSPFFISKAAPGVAVPIPTLSRVKYNDVLTSEIGSYNALNRCSQCEEDEDDVTKYNN